MANRVIGIFNILVGAFGIYAVGVKHATFILFPNATIGFIVCGVLIAYGVYILVRPSRRPS